MIKINYTLHALAGLVLDLCAAFDWHRRPWRLLSALKSRFSVHGIAFSWLIIIIIIVIIMVWLLP